MKKLLLAAVLVAQALGALTAEAATATVSRDFRFEATSPAALAVDNLVGDVRIEPAAAGAGFEVDVEVRAEADAQAEAEEIARAVEFRHQDGGREATLQVVLPESRFPRIYRAGAPSGWFSGRMYVDYLGERRRVTGDAADGIRIRVDLVIRAPADGRLIVRNVLGDATATAFTGDLTLDGSLGRLSARDGSGSLAMDSGSGSVEVRRHTGRLRADTGSGRVDIEDCDCEIAVDTGSGTVTVRGGSGELEADTGSGGVRVERFAGSIVADTGSGGVTVEELSAAVSFVADTGSGSVRVGGDLSQLTELLIDTGSGSVTLESDAWPSMEILIDTGSGGVSVDVPDALLRQDEDRRSVVRIGEAEARGIIDTGSGSVRLRTTVAPAAD